MSPETIHLPFGIELFVGNNGAGNVTSKLRLELHHAGDSSASRLRAEGACDAIESLLLAFACAGMNLSSPEARDAIETAIESIAQNLDTGIELAALG